MPLIDTLALKTGLLDGGMPEPQATAIVAALADADTGQLATKADMEALRADMRAEISGTRMEVEALRGDIKTLRWVGGVLLTLQVLVLGLLWRLLFVGATVQGAGGG